ncbi:TraR/DksA family transcriptional regulator [Streptomyces sp. SudanB182_2057]|uniref:TraR/DksA family transcriptional regulator n=1 Tax=Streptomyces sp. SudanB182_2057 TaxID=3035281 RepID=UPI003F56A957
MNRQTHDGSTTALSAEDLAALRENLNEQRLFRREQLRRLASPPAPRAGGVAARQTAARAEVGAKLAASARMVLTDVEAALKRMDEGSYGICRLCRRTIDLERLKIVPQARYCARCQQAKEFAS